jgi:hypothetical protein
MGRMNEQGLSGCCTGLAALGSGRELTGRVLSEELFEGLSTEVLEDSPLAFFPGLVQGAGSDFSAGTILDYTAGNAERSLDRFHGLAERYLRRGSRQPGATSAALLALDQTRVGELRQDASEQAPWNVGLSRDPLRRHPLPDPGQIE